jgi:hypothetical protein
MFDFRNDLETRSERFELAPGALPRMLERRRRKQRGLRIRAGVLAVLVAGIGTWGAVSALRDLGATRPGASPSQGIDQRSYALIAGTYTKTLTDDDPIVLANDMAGSYTMRLRADGVTVLSVPPGFTAEGTSPSGISFRLSGDRFTTNAFVNLTCEKSVGVYEWDLRDGRLSLIPLAEPCEVRAALFGTTPWEREP